MIANVPASLNQLSTPHSLLLPFLLFLKIPYSPPLAAGSDDGGCQGGLSNMMIRHGPFEVPSTLEPSTAVLSAMHALYWCDGFLGTCVAVAPRILVTAGHHYNAVKDDVGDFSVRHPGIQEVRVEHAAKNSAHDLLVLWVGVDLEHISLRGFLPPIQARVATVWLSTKWPHEKVVSPGVVIESSLRNCVARGTVSTGGSSGAPVIDYFGDHMVGMHLTSNTRDGSRVSGFIPARKIVSILAEMDVSCRTL